MVDAYYPRHELDAPADVEADALQDRLRAVEAVLKDVRDIIPLCSDPRCNCPGFNLRMRITATLEVPRAE